MNEHELCCGTVADKAKLCAEIEQRDRVIEALEQRIDELLQELYQIKALSAQEAANGSNP